jgi:hypothetical protein
LSNELFWQRVSGVCQILEMRIYKRLHYWTGLAGIIVFLLTGQYMDIYHEHLRGVADGPRMLYRATHIYIMLASIINLVLGVYLSEPQGRMGRVLQRLVSIVVLLAPLLLLAGFFTEPNLADLQRPYSRPALFGLFAAAVLLSVTGSRRGK